jgi:membrane-bound serine protease (ClpP class)
VRTTRFRPRRALAGAARSAGPRLVLSALFLLFSIFSLGQTPASIPAGRQAKNVAVITIRGEGPIDELTAQSVVRRLRIAEAGGADAIVFDIDTPGGHIMPCLAISAAIKQSRIGNTVAWINTRAFSGGAIIALACREIVAAPTAAIGDARPIEVTPEGMRLMKGELLTKFLPPLMADLVDSARRTGRDEFLLQAIALETVELWLIREKSTGRLLSIDEAEYRRLFGVEPDRSLPRIAGASPSRKALRPAPSEGGSSESEAGDRGYKPASPFLQSMAHDVDVQLEKRDAAPRSARPVLTAADRDQWEPVTYLTNGTSGVVLTHDDLEFLGLSAATVSNDEELKAFFGAQHLTRLEPSWSEGLVAFLSSMVVKGILVAVFLLAMFIEMTHPGTVLPGSVAFLALVALVAPPLLVDLSAWWAVAAILVGIVLIVLEILVIPGFGVFGVVGLLLLFGGLIGVIVPSGSLFPGNASERQDLLYGVVTLALALATSGTGMYFFAKHFRSLPVFNRLVLQDPVWDDDSPRDEMLAAMGDPGGPIKKGMIGITVTPLRPAGRVEMGAQGSAAGRIIDVVAEMGYIPAGSRVRIVSVSDFRIGVERVDEPGPGPGERAS